MARSRRLVLLVLVGACATPQGWDEPPVPFEPPPVDEPDAGGDHAAVLNAAAAVAVAAYGLQFWDYGSRGFSIVNEGWFGRNTPHGGADKLGHAFSSYSATVGFAALYEEFGYERESADVRGAASAMAAFTLIEVGDGLSKNGFSFEDLAMDATGVLFGYVRRRVPAMARYLDYRVEYFPSPAVLEGGRTDIATDYSGYRYLLALKLGGFEALRGTAAEFLEIHVGYYTRGYQEADRPYFSERSRRGYVGIGLDLGALFSRAGLRKLSPLFEFYQPPYTYLPATW